MSHFPHFRPPGTAPNFLLQLGMGSLYMDKCHKYQPWFGRWSLVFFNGFFHKGAARRELGYPLEIHFSLPKSTE
jgi:hypothetical protein